MPGAPMHAPPMNFAMASPGIFRSGFPNRHNLAFLQRLGLRTIVNLAEQPGLAYTGLLEEWSVQHNISVVTCNVIASREPFVVPDPGEIGRALRILVDQTQLPALIHGVRGDGAVSIVIGILRRLQHWSLTAVFDEHRRFASTGSSLLDLQVIELFPLSDVSSAPEAAAPAASTSDTQQDAEAAGEVVAPSAPSEPLPSLPQSSQQQLAPAASARG